MKPSCYRTIYFVTMMIFSACAFAGQGQNCVRETVGAGSVSSRGLESFLDCLAQQSPLTKLGAQWIILKNSKWSIDPNSQSRSSGFSYRFSPNPYDSNQRSFLSVSLSGVSGGNQRFLDLIQGLEQRVFPQALMGFVAEDKQGENQTSMAFEGTVYHNVALADTPINKKNTGSLHYWRQSESIRNYYPGTLVASSGFSRRSRSWYSNMVSRFPILSINATGGKYWDELRSYYNRYFDTNSCETNCLLRQEVRILQGMLMTLGHPDLAREVHEMRLGFQGYPYQNNLVRTIGCWSTVSNPSLLSGMLIYNYNLAGRGKSFGGRNARNLTRYGWPAFLGRALYLRGLDKYLIDRNYNRSSQGSSGQFQGQNAIIRKISSAAVTSLANIGGIADDKLNVLQFGNNYLNGVLPPGMTQDQAIDRALNYASKMAATYMRARHKGQSVKNHPVNSGSSRAFFHETVLSRGHTLKQWLDILYKLNPNVYYYIYGYDYGFKSATRFVNKSGTTYRVDTRSYYDRILKVLERGFKSIETLY